LLQLDGGGEWSIESIDAELSIQPSPAMIFGLNSGYVANIHNEGITITNASNGVVVQNNGNLQIGSFYLNNIGVFPGSTLTIFQNGNGDGTTTASGALEVGTLGLRDISSAGATLADVSTTNAGNLPIIHNITTNGTIRAVPAPVISISSRSPVLQSAAGAVSITSLSANSITDGTIVVTNGRTMSPYERVVGAMGTGIKAMNYDAYLVNSTATLVNGTMIFQAINLPNAQTLTGVSTLVGTAGNYTANNTNGVALYSYSGGTLTLVAQTGAGSGSTWGSGGYNKIPFGATYSASAGMYYIVTLYCRSAETTPPAIRCIGSPTSQAVILGAANGAVATGTLAGQVTFPASLNISTVTYSPSVPWVALY
jgi:hypothetical protein